MQGCSRHQRTPRVSCGPAYGLSGVAARACTACALRLGHFKYCGPAQALMDRMRGIVGTAGQMGVNVLCLQEAWTMPFACAPLPCCPGPPSRSVPCLRVRGAAAYVRSRACRCGLA